MRITGDSVDDFFVNLAQTFPGYYKDSCQYAYELINPPVRLVLYAAREILVSDLTKCISFVTSCRGSNEGIGPSEKVNARSHLRHARE